MKAISILKSILGIKSRLISLLIDPYKNKPKDDLTID